MPEKAGNWIKFWCATQLGGRVELSRGIGVTHQYPWHWHEEIQISAVEEGADVLSFRGARHTAPPGSLSFIPPGEVHCNRHTAPEGCTYRTLNVSSDLLLRAFRGLTLEQATFSLRQPVIEDRELFRWFVAVHARLEEPSPGPLSEILILKLLAELLRRTAGWRREPSPAGRAERVAVRRVREYLLDSHAVPVSLEELAKLANMSPYHLHRVFTREVGLSPHAFQTQVRISRARALLNEGRPLHEVAAETGFADQSHFTREFKRFVGLTPGAYRSHQLPAQNVAAAAYGVTSSTALSSSSSRPSATPFKVRETGTVG